MYCCQKVGWVGGALLFCSFLELLNYDFFFFFRRNNDCLWNIVQNKIFCLNCCIDCCVNNWSPNSWAGGARTAENSWAGGTRTSTVAASSLL